MSEKICLPDQGTVTACAQYSVVVGYVCVCVLTHGVFDFHENSE